MKSPCSFAADRVEALSPRGHDQLIRIYVSLLALVTVIREQLHRDPQSVESCLLACWDHVEAGYATGRHTAQGSACLKMMHEYFHHRGNWSEIQECLGQCALAAERIPQQVKRMLDDQVPETRRQYHANYRRDSN